MSRISVVIIARDEEHNIVECIKSAKLVSNDIIVVDTGSADETVRLATRCGARVIEAEWNGYGASRNLGAEKARNNWILALDADERISPQLATHINRLIFDDRNCIYRFRRRNFFEGVRIRFGTLGFETVKRIYNRSYARWDLTLVHERLETQKSARARLTGHISHFGLKTKEDYRAKSVLYAQLSAEKYFLQGKKPSFVKRALSPVFNSLKSFIFQLGFLDGVQGVYIAATIAYYSWLKYYYLHQLSKEIKAKTPVFSSKPQVEL